MSENFKAGDIVVLKSGSPKMTVSAVAAQMGKMKVFCDWFDGPKQSHGVFSPEALELAAPGPTVA